MIISVTEVWSRACGADRSRQTDRGDTDHGFYLLGGHVVHERRAQLAQLQVAAQRAVHAHLHTHAHTGSAYTPPDTYIES